MQKNTLFLLQVKIWGGVVGDLPDFVIEKKVDPDKPN